MTCDEYLAWITEPAQRVCGEYDLPWQVCVVQGALESGWGVDGIGNGGYNIFGRKWNGQGDYVELPTQEDDGAGNLYTVTAKFQSYASQDDAIRDWCVLMTQDSAYDNALAVWRNTKDIEEFVRAMAPVYATDVSYADKIMETINACGLS